jgi:hypothetical protein
MLDRLSQADRIWGASSAVALVATFLPWYRFDEGDHRVTANAFGSGFLGDVVFFAATAAIVLLLMAHGVIAVRNTPNHRRLALPLGAIALAAVVSQMLVGINGSGAFHSLTIGIVVALLATAGMTLGGLMQRQDTGAMRHVQGRR